MPALAQGRKSVGDAALRITVDASSAHVAEAELLIENERLREMSAVPWVAEIDGTEVKPGECAISHAGEKSLKLSGETPNFSWELLYSVAGAGRIRKNLTITPKSDFVLGRVWLWDAEDTMQPLVAKTSVGAQPIAAFYRGSDRGLFASLDFPWSQITTTGTRTRIGYPPFAHLKTGQAYKCHSLTVGATRLSGKKQYGYFAGEVAAMDNYVQEHRTPRFDRPMFVAASITNRWVLMMKDNPAINWLPDVLKRDIDIVSKAGIEYYQTWPGGLDASESSPTIQQYDEIRNFARERGVRTGDYSSVNQVYLDGYNLNGMPPLDPKWKLVDEKGKAHATHYCLGCPAFLDYYLSRIIPHIQKTHSQIHCLDFMVVQPCFDKSHGHPVGADSMYAQVLGLTRALEAINDTSPDMMTWSNSGYWGMLLPKLAWYNHNLYLTDPYVSHPWQNLNSTRLLDDTRRQQMYETHFRDFLPFRFFTNYQYFTVQNSIVPDVRGNYQFGALSTIAVTPNLGLGELRIWTDTLPEARRQEVFAFYRKWTDFLKQNYSLWKQTWCAGEAPGPGSVEIYCHSQEDHGFIFVVNPNDWSRTVAISLNESLGFSGKGKCELTELYPVERLRLTASGPFAEFGTTIPLEIEPQQVLVLEVKPAPATITSPRLYGIAGTIEKSSAEVDSWLLKTSGLQGQTARFAVMLPEKSAHITSASVRDYPWIWPYLKTPTPIRLLAGSENVVLGELTFRQTSASTELRHWRVKTGTVDPNTTLVKAFTDGELLNFPLFSDTAPEIPAPLWGNAAEEHGLGPLAGFCGARIDNAPTQMQETWIDLTTDTRAGSVVAGAISSGEQLPRRSQLPSAAKSQEKSWLLCTTFTLPYQYIVGMEPPFDDHTNMVLPFLDPAKIRQVRAWVNGAPLEVRMYKYPRNRELGCYYADLTGSPATGGENSLVLQFEAK